MPDGRQLATDNPAREFDPETSQYYYRARYYDPSTGSFISEDPITFKGGINFYGYAGQNSVNFIDPTGLKQCVPCQESDDLKKALKGAQNFLDSLKTTGSVVGAITPTTKVGGTTICQLFTIRRPGKKPIEFTSAQSFINIDPNQNPCIYKCVQEHENVHKQGCEQMGAKRYNALTEAQQEIPAYEKEISCYKKLLGQTQ
ncbi:MAG: RHS repeat-associated core domain-containing protein [Candidatus Acidiferrum sp.]